ncbi:MAG TPA: class I SAM-dependent methyltransferase [Pirellulales bacterium]|jgi:SAM-dependent methyltransferase|nr:class I SAM-dependent methyltransferase [Pirellulales bacterium]
MQNEQYELHAEIEEHHWWFLGRRRIMRSVLAEACPPSKQTRVLDVGCGTGGNIAVLADDYSCVGIDHSARAIELARERFPQVRFVHGQVPDDVHDELHAADVVLLMDVLEHVADDTGFLGRIVDALAPGAHLLITVPADPRLWSPHDVAFGHYRRYDRSDLAAVWADLPIATRLVSYYNSRLLPVIRTVRSVNQRRNRASGAAGTDFNLPAKPINRMLERFFAGESRVLRRALDNERYAGYRRGASLIALVERQAVALPMHRLPMRRTLPAAVAADGRTKRAA